MNALLRMVLMAVLLTGLQGMAVDYTCVLLWHTAPLSLAEDGIGGVHGHHPNSPESHQGGGDGVTQFGNFGSALLDHADMPALVLLLPTPQGSSHQPAEMLIHLFELPSFDKDDPPKQTAFV